MQQRVATAPPDQRAVQLSVADEPTGQLDSVTGRSIVALLLDLVHAGNVATHDPTLVGLADEVVDLRDGRLAPPVVEPA